MNPNSRVAISAVLKVRLTSSMLALPNRSCSSWSFSAPLGQRLGVPVDAGAAFHRVLHLGADVGDPLPAVARGQHIVFEPPPFVGGLRSHGWALESGACDAANSAAAMPARRPNTNSSGSELDPSRFAPLMLTQATSPAAYSPGRLVAPWMSVWTPPIM